MSKVCNHCNIIFSTVVTKPGDNLTTMLQFDDVTEMWKYFTTTGLPGHGKPGPSPVSTWIFACRLMFYVVTIIIIPQLKFIAQFFFHLKWWWIHTGSVTQSCQVTFCMLYSIWSFSWWKWKTQCDSCCTFTVRKNLEWSCLLWERGPAQHLTGKMLISIIIWLDPWAGKMNQILRSDWLPEQAR